MAPIREVTESDPFEYLGRDISEFELHSMNAYHPHSS